jgi:DNA-binding transcriptional MerR regulator
MKSSAHTSYITISEAARRVGVSADTIRRYGDEGIYQERRILNQRALTEDDIAAIETHRKHIRPRAACRRG